MTPHCNARPGRTHATPYKPRPSAWRAHLLCGVVALLSACGGGDTGSSTDGPASCELADQQRWVKTTLDDWYLFNTRMPSVDAAAFNSIEAYFDALLVKQDEAGAALDRWSHVQDAAQFDAYYGEGRSLGYGLFVAGQADDPLPLRVRYVAPDSAAAQAGLARGMVIDGINGADPAQLKAAGDFAALTPTAVDQVLTLRVRDSATAAPRELSLRASVYPLQPVAPMRVLTSPGGRRIAYLFYKDFLGARLDALGSALAEAQAAGVSELILDLRYNGGGQISAAQELAGSLGGASAVGQRFATLSYNARHADATQHLNFGTALPRLGLSRVYVLTGVRTCSASEMVVNGLAPFVPVVSIGAATCGKPYGFNPRSACGKTFNAVNFEIANALGVGGYRSGLAPDCAVTEDFDRAMDDPGEALTAAALSHADTGRCPSASGASQTLRRPSAGAGARPIVRDGEPYLSAGWEAPAPRP